MMLPLLFLLLGVGALVMGGKKSIAADSKTIKARQKMLVGMGGAGSLVSSGMQIVQSVGQQRAQEFIENQSSYWASPQGQAEIARRDKAPYRLVDAVAMANMAIEWGSDPQNSDWIQQISTTPRAELAEILKTSLSDDEKVRAIICSILLPLACNEKSIPGGGHWNEPSRSKNSFTTGETGLDGVAGRIRSFREWFTKFYVTGTEIQQKQLLNLTLWACLYFIGPVTGCVLKTTVLAQEYTSLPRAGTPVTIYRNDQWILKPSIEQQQRAIVDILLRMMGWKREFVKAIEKCDVYDPNPCLMSDGWMKDISAIFFDQDNVKRNYYADTITGTTLRFVKMIQRVQIETMAPETVLPAFDPFILIMTTIAAAIATVASLGAAAGVIAPAIAAGITVAISTATTAVGIAQSVQNRAGTGPVMQQILNSSLTKTLVGEAALLLPADIAKAAGTISDAVKTLPVQLPKF